LVIESFAFPKFVLAWVPALALSLALPEPAVALGDLFIVNLAGLPVPVVTCALGALGVIAARPFTRLAEKELGWKLRWLVTFIMLIVVQLWIIESRPGWLFAFVVAVGLGFAGYSLLELFGDQVKDFVRRAFAAAASTIGKGPPSQ
jgi:hypothetical protein